VFTTSNYENVVVYLVDHPVVHICALITKFYLLNQF